ncbi:MAG: sulfite exporter TauE/SafE family protein [Candidatus Kaiserbacteria bacterium]|nr:sulfite exporter TauE/SafE family protein [Candidatus Kaiserbacteria bacterium]
MLGLFFISFIAGILTVFVPCIFPLLPVIIGGSVSDSKRNSYVIIGSLVVAIVLFTIIIKVSSDVFGVPTEFWNYISGALVALVGLTFIFPNMWSHVPFVAGLHKNSNSLLSRGYGKSGFFGDSIIGSALAPAFTSCSPTYLLILAVILPNNLLQGSIYLFAYALGVGTILLFASLIGQSIVQKLGWLSDGSNVFRKIIGVVIFVVGIMLITGYDKVFAAWLLDIGFIDLIGAEENLLKSVTSEDVTSQ